MSYFLCMAVPEEVASELPTIFDKSIYLTPASSFPIGQMTRGKNRRWAAFLLQIGSSSASLVGKAGRRRTHNNDRTGLLISGFHGLLEREECSSLSFLLHWMRGEIASEVVDLNGERQIRATDLSQVVLDIEEDVRYTASRE